MRTADLDSMGAAPALQDAVEPRATILLVHEEAAALAAIGNELRRHGYRVLPAATAAHACEICALAATEIDLLITDVARSDVAGPGLAQRLVGARPQLRVLFLSGEDGVELPFTTAHPNISLLHKPFLASALLATVDEALARLRTNP